MFTAHAAGVRGSSRIAPRWPGRSPPHRCGCARRSSRHSTGGSTACARRGWCARGCHPPADARRSARPLPPPQAQALEKDLDGRRHQPHLDLAAREAVRDAIDDRDVAAAPIRPPACGVRAAVVVMAAEEVAGLQPPGPSVAEFAVDRDCVLTGGGLRRLGVKAAHRRDDIPRTRTHTCSRVFVSSESGGDIRR